MARSLLTSNSNDARFFPWQLSRSPLVDCTSLVQRVTGICIGAFQGHGKLVARIMQYFKDGKGKLSGSKIPEVVMMTMVHRLGSDIQ